MTRATLFVAVLAMLSTARGAAAGELPGEVTADQAVALFRERNPRLAADRATLEVTAADRVEADIYPNPTLSLGSTNTVHGSDTIGHSQEAVGLELPLLIGGQRGHRARAADARVASRRAELDVDQGKAELEIRRRFLVLQAAQEKATAMGAAVDDARAVRAIVAGRQQAGVKSSYELERTDLALAALASKQDEAQTEAVVASGALAAAVGVADWRPRAAGAFRPSEVGAAALAIDHPALIADASAQAAARSDQALAHAEAIPTPSLQLQGFGTTDPQGLAVMVGVAIPLPLLDRNQGAVARARAQEHAAVLAQRATSGELSAEITRAAGVERDRRAAVTRFEADAVDRLPRVRAMAESAYRSGQGGIVELLDALDAITDARLRDIDLVAAALDAALDVRAAARGR